MESSSNSSLKNRQSSSSDITFRQETLKQIIEEAKIRGDIINENYLLYQMTLREFPNYSRSKLYQDRLALDTQNNYIRDFLPNYSKYQEDINSELDSIREEAIELSKIPWVIKKTTSKKLQDGTTVHSVTQETGNQKYRTELLKIRAKVAELKQKHSEGQNINISAVIVQKELLQKKHEIEELKSNVIQVVK